MLPKKTNQSSQTNSVILRPIPRDIPTGENISPASLSIETEHDHYPLSTTEVKITITNHSHYEYECEFRYDQRVTRSRKEKRRKYFYFLRFSTQTRGRTGMEGNPLVFETSASTDSAIWAHTWFLNCGAKIRHYFDSTIVWQKKGEKNNKTYLKHFSIQRINRTVAETLK